MDQTLHCKAQTEKSQKGNQNHSPGSGPASQGGEASQARIVFGAQCELGMNSVSLDAEHNNTSGARLHSVPSLALAWLNFPSSAQSHQGAMEPTEMGSLMSGRVLANLPHSHQGLRVLAGLLVVGVVWRTTVPGVPIWGSRLYTYLEGKIGKWVVLKWMHLPGITISTERHTQPDGRKSGALHTCQ